MNENTLHKVRTAGKIAGKARNYGLELIHVGVSYLEVARKVEAFIESKGGKPAFPVNIAVNNIAAHYTPTHDDELLFKPGDIVKLDVGAHVDGYIGDTAATVEVDKNDNSILLRASKEALEVAIDMIRPGTKIRDIGAAVERTIMSYNLKPIENLTGHCMERYNLHTGLSVPSVDDHSENVIKEGAVLAIEPFATNGAGQVGGHKPGNIYKFVRIRDARSKEVRALMEYIQERYSSLPFAQRWCHQMDKRSGLHLKKMAKMGSITSYPILNDIGGGLVSQHEHTVLVLSDGVEVLT